uniref:NB-ARC domain-containing protein n=1 Tax=Leersia perrieri TaxID=77586 RepID=A0A0D9WHQ9_9ORYZ
MEDCIDQYEGCVEQYEQHAATLGYRSGSKIRRNKLIRRSGNNKTPLVPEKLKQRLWMANKIREFSLRVQEALQRHADAVYSNELGGIANTSTATARESAPMTSSPMSALMLPLTVQDWLSDGEKQLKVVSIVGVGGVGKTTLANELYRKLGRQFECRAFVRSSQKIDMRRLLISMLSQLRLQQPPDNWRLHSLISSIRHIYKIGAPGLRSDRRAKSEAYLSVMRQRVSTMPVLSPSSSGNASEQPPAPSPNGGAKAADLVQRVGARRKCPHRATAVVPPGQPSAPSAHGGVEAADLM